MNRTNQAVRLHPGSRPGLHTLSRQTDLRVLFPQRTISGARNMPLCREKAQTRTPIQPPPDIQLDSSRRHITAFDFVGVARGDVKRIVLRIPGESQFPDATLYERGTTWGQFSSALALRSPTTVPQLRIYGDKGLVQVLRLALRPGEQHIYG